MNTRKAVKQNPPENRLQGLLPRIGIRPVIDGRRQGVREALENQTMTMAHSVAKLISLREIIRLTMANSLM